MVLMGLQALGGMVCDGDGGREQWQQCENDVLTV